MFNKIYMVHPSMT